MSELCNMYPIYYGPFSSQYNCRKIEVNEKTLDKNECIELRLIYPNGDLDFFERALLIGKRNETLFILSDNFNLTEQQKILDIIDFTKSNIQ